MVYPTHVKASVGTHEMPTLNRLPIKISSADDKEALIVDSKSEFPASAFLVYML